MGRPLTSFLHALSRTLFLFMQHCALRRMIIMRRITHYAPLPVVSYAFPPPLSMYTITDPLGTRIVWKDQGLSTTRCALYISPCAALESAFSFSIVNVYVIPALFPRLAPLCPSAGLCLCSAVTQH